MNNIQKDEILRKAFEYFVDNGLENVTMRNLCKETGMSVSSAYYWFGDKDGAIISATEWGLDDVAGKLFEYIYKYIDNLQIVIITFSEFAMEYKKQLRFIYQVATSTKYGNEIRPLAAKLSLVYDRYSEIIAKHFGCNKQDIIPYAYLFVSAVLDYVVWNDKNKMEVELSCIYKAITNYIKN